MPGPPHKMSTVRRAHELYDAGFVPEKIAQLLKQEGTATVHANTVRGWVDTNYGTRQAESVLRSQARARARQRPMTLRGLCPQEPTQESQDARMALLADAGLGWRNIAKVMRIDFGEHWNENEVRARLEGPAAAYRRAA